MLNTAPFGTGQYLRNEVRKYHLRRKRKEANDAKLGKGKGRSGGRAAPTKDRKANNKEKSKAAEPCTVDWLRGGSGAYLRWIAQTASQEKAIS